MKLTLLWAVAACVAAAGLPCHEYCTCVYSGKGNVATQSECNCVHGDSELGVVDDSGIYYEPAEYVCAPSAAYERPFYILNPYGATYQQYEEITHGVPSTQIEINVKNADNSHTRKEKAVHSDIRKSVPAYLDIDVESEDNQRTVSAQKATIEDFVLTEQSIAECADLYAHLSYKTNYLNTRVPNQFGKYNHLSNTELMKKIDEKCSELAFIVQNSLREIKGKQPRKINRIFRENGVEQDEEKQSDSYKLNNKLAAGTATTQLPIRFTEEDRTAMEEYDDNRQHIIVIYTDTESDEATTETSKSLITEAPSTETIWTSTQHTTPLYEISIKDLEQIPIITNNRLQEIHPDTIMNIEDERLNNKNATRLNTTLITVLQSNQTKPNPDHVVEASISRTTQNSFNGNQRYNDSESEATEMEVRRENHTHYEEGEVPLMKVITHEFSNDTVISIINGTEDVPNGDFGDELTQRFFENYEDKNRQANLSYNRSHIEPTIKDTDRFGNDDITGKLYLVYNHQPIPARFIQKPDGMLHVGIDGSTLCDKLTQDGDHKSTLLITLCKCYKFNNCTGG